MKKCGSYGFHTKLKNCFKDFQCKNLFYLARLKVLVMKKKLNEQMEPNAGNVAGTIEMP